MRVPGARCRQAFQRHGAVFGDVDDQSCIGKQIGGYFLVQFVVLGQHYASARHRGEIERCRHCVGGFVARPGCAV